MNWIGIKRKPCGRITGIFIFGPQMCGNLTFKRVLDMGELVPDCDRHRPETPEAKQRRTYDREVGSLQPISPLGEDILAWHEVALSDCPYGCKIYEHSETGERVLSHNNSYGCTKERV